MYINYDQAVKKLVQNKKDSGICNSVICSFKHHAKEFKKFLMLRGIPFRLYAAKEWVNQRKKETTYGSFKLLRHAIAEIVKFIMPDVNVIVEFYEFTIPYQRLERWSKSELNEFLHIYPHRYSEIRQSISLMLVWFQEKGLKSFNEVTCLHIVEYRKLPGRHLKTGIRAFLTFLKSKGYLGPFVAESFNSFFCNRIYNFQKDELSESGKIFSIYDYCKAWKKLYKTLEENNYSKTIKDTSRAAFIEFGLFLECNKFLFSNSLVFKWLSIRFLKKKTLLPIYRKCLYQISDILESENDFNITKIYSTKELPPVPDWVKPYVIQFLAKRRKEVYAKSTLEMDFNSIRRFFLFAESTGCTNLKDITVKIIKKFNEEDVHKTNAGKAAYNVHIREFFSFLAETGDMPEYFSYALPSTSHTGSKPTKTLSTEQRKLVVQAILNPPSGRSPKRDSSILAMGLLCGLRASDIIKLKFDEIDWKNQEFSIIQQKTRTHLRIPFPEIVGNRLCSYITDERPDSTCDYVFIVSRAPFHPIKRGCCNNTLSKVTNHDVTGFHILRKTFASNLLCEGSSISLIADTLGHQNNSTVDTYLDTNTSMISLCSLGLDGIEYKGGTL